jgi:hypothetical protein
VTFNATVLELTSDVLLHDPFCRFRGPVTKLVAPEGKALPVEFLPEGILLGFPGDTQAFLPWGRFHMVVRPPGVPAPVSEDLTPVPAPAQKPAKAQPQKQPAKKAK